MGNRRRLVVFAALCGTAVLVACSEKRAPGERPATSPQATALPAPFAISPTPTRETPLWGDAGIVSVPVRGDREVPADVLPHDLSGPTLSAIFRVPDAIAHRGDDPLSKRSEARVSIELADQRMRIVHRGSGFALPEGTELRARADRYGHVLFMGDTTEYRVMPVGSLRALYTDRRRDVAPVGAAVVKPLPGTSSRLGVTTRRIELETRAGQTTFEIGRVPETGDRGTLLARYLLDLVCARTQTTLVGTDEIPLRAEIHWRENGTLIFEVTQIGKKAELAAAGLSVVPPSARFSVAPIPAQGVEMLLSAKEVALIRGAPPETGPNSPPPEAKNDLVVYNTSNNANLVVVEGVPVAWMRPQTRGLISGLARGRYQVQLRTFLGDHVEAPVTAQVPGSLGLVTRDAGPR